MQRDREKPFTYGYLPGTHLLQTLVKPNNMTLTQSYEEKRDLLISQLYKRSNASVASRTYTYDTLGRPMTRSISKNGSTVNDSFGYNSRSELNTATVNNEAYTYDYDNIGNRLSSQSSAGAEADAAITEYTANQLNQYAMLSVDDIADFIPSYDAAGNQCRVKTSTGIWAVSYDAENRPTDFTSQAVDGTITTVHCEYDYMGRRATKQVTTNGNITLHQRYLYRGYLQIAALDLTRAAHPALWYITWDPTQPIATRPLAIQHNGTWYTYGWDLTKNICEVYSPAGYIRTAYTYAPYGEVSAEGDVEQPIQWSSEYNDTELGLIYYNYRHYNPTDGRWIGRDMLGEKAIFNLVKYVNNSPIVDIDKLGNDRVYSTLQEFPYIHARVSIDNWIVVNGKYKKSGVYIYEFGIVIQADTTLSAIVKTVVTIPTSLVWAEGTVSKTNASRHLDGYHAHSNPCQDLATIKIGDAEASVKHYYNIFFHNCQVWATNFFRTSMFGKYIICCNPDGTSFRS